MNVNSAVWAAAGERAAFGFSGKKVSIRLM
jgi:hypothetical protein